MLAAAGGCLAINKVLQSTGQAAEVLSCCDVAKSIIDPRPKSSIFAARQGTPLA
jgi:hypothetical protein